MTKVQEMELDWADPPRWKGIERSYSAEDVLRLRGSVQIDYTLAKLGSERLWDLMNTTAYVKALGAMTGGQAIQQVQAGLQAVYCSGWQVAADANVADSRLDTDYCRISKCTEKSRHPITVSKSAAQYQTCRASAGCCKRNRWSRRKLDPVS